MSLDERAQGFLETIAFFGLPAVNAMTVAEARARKIPVMGGCEPIAEQRDLAIPVRHGEIPARLYVPLSDTTQTEPVEFPVIVYIHGGGWVLGELPHYDQLCCALAKRSGCAVISLAYRLAPEFPFPAAVEDCLDAVEWISQQELTSGAGQFPPWATRSNPLFLMGDSAGGNLAAVIAESYCQHAETKIAGQILLYPVTDSQFTQDSYRRNGSDYLLTTELMQWFWDHYCPDLDQRLSAAASPMYGKQLALLPPTYLQTCQYDPLVDEGNEYGQKLRGAGVDLEHHEVPGMIHGFMRYLHTFPQADAQLHEIARWIRQRLA